MKKVISLFIPIVLMITLSACGKSVSANARQGTGSVNNTSSVGQILENAAKTTPTPSLETPTQTIETEIPTSTLSPAPIVGGTPDPTPETVLTLDATPAPAPTLIEVAPTPTPEPVGEVQKIDVDLTQMSSTMVYSEVYNMMMEPDAYIGKTVRMYGPAVSSTVGNITYYAVIIEDATACCAQGLEYLLQEGQEYPTDYDYATVTGEFETYQEGQYLYCRLKNATITL